MSSLAEGILPYCLALGYVVAGEGAERNFGWYQNSSHKNWEKISNYFSLLFCVAYEDSQDTNGSEAARFSETAW
jgi:hypothetical protein